jgi:DNA-directed RNA polymerase beta subunit
MFRSIALRSYEAFEEDDMLAKTKTRIGNPARIPGWTSLKAGIDYSKLDERGIIRVGEWVDETTVLVGRYMQTQSGEMRDASVTAQVWTSGRVEKVAITTNNAGLALVKIRVTQDRQPELGDKFSTRHGQKGTMGMLVRAHDMPRSATGMVPDMVVNPHCMPSRMTMAQLLESLLGKSAAGLGAIGNATAFMNSGDPSEQIGKVLVNQLGLQPLGEEILYDGASGQMIPSTIFVGTVYTMRLKHMVEDKWNARAEGRREQRTHQPTGGRGAQGGLRIGEMERDAIVGHGVMDFVRESIMKRADGYSTYLCNGCGTIPIYNESKRQFICPMCDGPVRFIGDSTTNLEVLPPNKRSLATFSKVEIPYALKLLDQELSFFMNIGMRFLTDHDITKLRGPPIVELTADEERAALDAPLPERTLVDTIAVEKIEPAKEFEVRAEDLSALGVTAEEEAPMEKPNPKVLNAAVTAAVVDKMQRNHIACRQSATSFWAKRSSTDNPNLSPAAKARGRVAGLNTRSPTCRCNPTF